MEEIKTLELYKINDIYSCNIEIKKEYIRTSALTLDDLFDEIKRLLKDENF